MIKSIIAAALLLSSIAYADDVTNCAIITTVPLSVSAGPISIPLSSLHTAWQCNHSIFTTSGFLTVDQPSLVKAALSGQQMIVLSPGSAAGPSIGRTGQGYGNTVIRYNASNGELGQINVVVLP